MRKDFQEREEAQQSSTGEGKHDMLRNLWHKSVWLKHRIQEVGAERVEAGRLAAIR